MLRRFATERAPRALACLAVGTAVAATASVASAATFVVAPNGDDRAAGSASAPWATLAHAAAVAPAGSVVQVRSGRYVGFAITRSGLPGAPTVFAAAPGATPVLVGDDAHPEVVRIAGAHDVVVRGFEITGAPALWGAGVGVERSPGGVVVEGNAIHDDRSFGVEVADSTGVVVRGNLIAHNETGVQFEGAVPGGRIEGNVIRDNDRMVVNDALPWNDRGAVGVSLYLTTGPLLVRGNRIFGNHAPSHDYGIDGGAFEIYGASGVRMTGNTLYDNNDVLETGTDGVHPCEDDVLDHNIAWGASTLGPAQGLILRCARRMVVAANTFVDLDSFVYDLSSDGGFAGSIEDLTIRDNIAFEHGSHPYSLDTDLPASVRIDHNLSYDPGGPIAFVRGHGNTDSLAEFRAWTGYDAGGVQADPRFVDAAGHDFRLAPGSPAHAAGVPIPGIVGGGAPDLGASPSGAAPSVLGTGPPAAATLVPVNVAPPVVRGRRRVGGRLRCLPGRWTAAAVLRFRWVRARGGRIVGRGARYRVRRADAGRALRCVVVAVRGGAHRTARSRLVQILR
jgi:hypothetical protein